jgi:hypothetical protein
MLLAFGMIVIFGGLTIVPERVVNGFRLRRRQRSQSDIAHRTRTRHQAAAIAIDILKRLAEILIRADHDARGS